MLSENIILTWAEDRGILAKGNILAQIGKHLEEVGELLSAISANDLEEIKDARGDISITHIILEEMLTREYGDTTDQCLDAAYKVISGRKGVMKNGIFVKEGESHG